MPAPERLHAADLETLKTQLNLAIVDLIYALSDAGKKLDYVASSNDAVLYLYTDGSWALDANGSKTKLLRADVKLLDVAADYIRTQPEWDGLVFSQQPEAMQKKMLLQFLKDVSMAKTRVDSANVNARFRPR